MYHIQFFYSTLKKIIFHLFLINKNYIYLRGTMGRFDICTLYEMITNLLVINISITSHTSSFLIQVHVKHMNEKRKIIISKVKF